jgi:CheY-like chemotaxis protein
VWALRLLGFVSGSNRDKLRAQKGKSVPRILVADDNTNIQKMVALAFEDRGVDVVSVGNGEAAVRRIPDLNPDLVLADVFMPVRNGYEVCEFVKKDERFSHVPVILLVGAFDPLDEKEARRVGADGVLKKPFVPPDPLIAMVMSALEKNPKVAAEMAKAKEAAAAPPPEPLAPVLEAPAHMEPKPLPEFPEPTPEEAAQIYGFGKGVRATDDEETPAEERKAPKTASKKRQPEVEDDEDDAASLTAHDWRRGANKFEVPDEPGGKLAFSSDEDFNPVTFPSELDVPPRHVRVPDEDEVFEQAAQESQPVEAPAPVEALFQTTVETTVQAIARIEPQARPAQPEPEPVIASQSTPAQEVTAPEVAQEEIVQGKVAEPEAVPAATSEKASEKKRGGWMDMMTSPTEYSEGGWLTSIFKNKSAHKQENVAPAEPVAEPPAQPVMAASAPEIAPVGKTYDEHKAERHVAPGSAAVEEPLPAEPETTPQPEAWFAPPPPPVLREASESRLLPVVSSTSSLDDNFIAPPPDVSGAQRDPELEEPAAARTMPEPLLVNDNEEPSEPSRFSRTSEQPSPLHSFFAPNSGDPSASEALHEEDPAMHDDFDSSVFATPEVALPPLPESRERIPTAPPPNREALADIPFLMPPPPPPFESAGDNHRATDSASTDEVVARVLERLGPQLHQLLSQSVKPLVENLLQQELEKKGK